MRLLLIAAAAAAIAASSPAAQPGRSFAEPAACASISEAARAGQKVTLRKLGELPPANAYLAVYRRDADGCIVPVIAGYGYGSVERRRDAHRR